MVSATLINRYKKWIPDVLINRFSSSVLSPKLYMNRFLRPQTLSMELSFLLRHDSKVMQNSTESPSKRSRIERKMDLVIYILFTVLVLISLISSIGTCSRRTPINWMIHHALLFWDIPSNHSAHSLWVFDSDFTLCLD
jgi:hypothetical protein